MRKIYLFIILFITVFNGKAQTPLTIAVDFTTSDVNGNVHNLFNYLDNNKYVLLDFFLYSL